MSIRLTRPSSRALARLANASANDSLTYTPIGICSSVDVPRGYRIDRWSTNLGDGKAVFDTATDAIRRWQPHRGAGLLVSTDTPPSTGMIVAMAAPLPVGYIEAVCRVVLVVDEPDRFGFAYGTLPIHPEQGEESFMVTRHDDDTVTFDIVAVSRPRHLLARAVPPIARRLQHAAVNRYLEAMKCAVLAR
ncbi:MAG: DUF1990 family protein [Acidimicrobiia bacterium]